MSQYTKFVDKITKIIEDEVPDGLDYSYDYSGAVEKIDELLREYCIDDYLNEYTGMDYDDWQDAMREDWQTGRVERDRLFDPDDEIPF